jgi:hypothetical protein
MLVAAAALIVLVAGAALSHARDGEASSLRSNAGKLALRLDRDRRALGRVRKKLDSTRAELQASHAVIADLRHASAKRARTLERIRAVAGQQLPLTDDPCGVNLALAAARGLRAPDEFAIHCPGPALDWSGDSHWGVTCPYASCPEGPGPYVSISNPTYYVVAHELCHAAFGYGGGREEALADACAAAHGASLATSPYR